MAHLLDDSAALSDGACSVGTRCRPAHSASPEVPQTGVSMCPDGALLVLCRLAMPVPCALGEGWSGAQAHQGSGALCLHSRRGALDSRNGAVVTGVRSDAVARVPGGPLFTALLSMCLALPVQAADNDPLLTALETELARLQTSLASQPEPPHWMEVQVVDRHTLDLLATHGASGGPPRWHHSRVGDVDVRVGSAELDNTHKLRDAGWYDEEARFALDLPLADEDPRVTQLALWRAAEATYREAARRLIRVKSNDAVKVDREDGSADFSAAPKIVDIQPTQPLELDTDAWQAALRAASARFLDHPIVFDSNVSLHAQDDVTYLINTDGTRIRHQRWRLRVSVWAGTVAEDGQELSIYDYVDAASPGGLPTPEALNALVDQLAVRLEQLREAPLVDPYVGPAILRGRAAGVFFHEILGHRVEGHRQKDEDEGQTLTDKVGQRIFPAFIQVTDDPTIKQWPTASGPIDLNGHYPYDDEGVASERVKIIEDGVLKGFLMSRAPIESQSVSNGHGRRQPGSAVVARQGNLIVAASPEATMPYDQLRGELLALLEVQDKPFGLIFDDISGGFTLTGRGTPNSYAVQPVTVWRVWRDGRPDELVRGVDLIGTPLQTFDRIAAASDRTEPFNGMCGAESGWVPVSAVAPDLLISELEVQRREKQNDRPPLLPPPALSDAGGAR